MRTRNRPSPEEDRWRGDPAVGWLIAIEFVFLVAATVVLIAVFPGSGFWPWLVLAAAMVVIWVLAVAILVPRSAPRR